MSFSMLPNALSIIRIILTVPIVIALLKEQYLLTLMLFLFAGITDALDGWIAKQFSFQSRLGSILDPMADKILLASTFLGLYWVGILPLWLLLLIFFRDIIIVAGALGYFLGEVNESNELLKPTLISKFNTVLQIALILFLLLMQIYIELNSFKDMLYIVCLLYTSPSPRDRG